MRHPNAGLIAKPLAAAILLWSALSYGADATTSSIKIVGSSS